MTWLLFTHYASSVYLPITTKRKKTRWRKGVWESRTGQDRSFALCILPKIFTSPTKEAFYKSHLSSWCNAVGGRRSIWIKKKLRLLQVLRMLCFFLVLLVWYISILTFFSQSGEYKHSLLLYPDVAMNLSRCLDLKTLQKDGIMIQRSELKRSQRYRKEDQGRNCF